MENSDSHSHISSEVIDQLTTYLTCMKQLIMEISVSILQCRMALDRSAAHQYPLILLVLDVHSYVSMRQSISSLAEQREAFSCQFLGQGIVFHRLHTNAYHKSVLIGSVERSYVVILKLPGSLFASRYLLLFRHCRFPQQQLRSI